MFGKRQLTINFEVGVIIDPDEDEFHAYCPSLKGVHTFGRTEEEAETNMREAVSAYILSLIKHKDPIPLCLTVDIVEDIEEGVIPRERRYVNTQLAVAIG